MKKILFLATLIGVTSVFAADGEALFKTCTTCHGTRAEKSALNKSQVIAGWSSDKTVAALNGYKDGTYGGTLKGTMTAQVKNLSADDIKALAAYISRMQ